MEYVREEDEEPAPDVDERTGHSDNNEPEHPAEEMEDEQQDEATEMQEEKPTIVDVPKRMRKDVDEADVEEGEVFDDDEDEKTTTAPGEGTMQKEGQESTEGMYIQ